MQVDTGDFNNLFVPSSSLFSRLFLYKPKYMTDAIPSGRMTDFEKALPVSRLRLTQCKSGNIFREIVFVTVSESGLLEPI